MIKTENYDTYLMQRRGKEYRINVVVEEERDSFIVMSIRHSFTGDRNDGLFVVHFMDGLKDMHYTIHHDGTRHFKIRDPDTETMTFPFGNCGRLSEFKVQTQVLAGAIGLQSVGDKYSKTARDIDRFSQYPDQIITLNRKHLAKVGSISYSLSILPYESAVINISQHYLNPNIYVFNLPNRISYWNLHQKCCQYREKRKKHVTMEF